MDTNQVREQFESAFIAQQVAAFGEYTREGAVHRLKRDGEFDKPPTAYDLHRREQGMYDEYWIEMLWWAWQASREAVVVELPPRKSIDYYCYDQGANCNAEGHNQCLEQAAGAIEAQGLKVAP
ncbi:hypothetical protein EGJ51_17915 [Pseudomonas fulva]|uniref:hypothetical protein n=1 Tax=Pseudomonas fulva TaxID=47880 RepID=UPI000F7780AD|nr:hypothetical protein [Pseudomonas fulva]RRW59516.1 hypothetical protein EGJ51_17915 [Pseudomonas fulva]